jgi:phosphatidylinositol alpha-1,6-mannosyltransferase
MEQFSYDLTTSVAARTRTHIIANRRGKAALPFFVIIAFFRALFRLPHYDILHIGDPVLSVLAFLLKKFRSRPTAVTVHGLDILYKTPVYQWYLRRFLSSSDLYICISAFVERTLRTRFGITRTMIIPPGIRDTLYRPEVRRADLAPILGAEKWARPILLTVGRLVRRKGIAWFVGNVLPRLPQEILYIVVSSGPEKSAIEEEAQRHGVRDRVLLTGTVDEDTLRTLYNTADIFVMPNILVEDDAEGFGLVALEAASCARPVIASAVQGIVDAIYDGRNGFLVEAQDAAGFVEQIQRLLADEHGREQFGIAARQFTLNRFAWNTIAQKYLDAFSYLRRI